jgi:hypothetical protein
VSGQISGEGIRHHSAIPRDDRRTVIYLSLEGRGDLHRLNLGLKGSSECTIDHAVKALFESVEKSHVVMVVRGPSRMPQREALL